MLLVILEELPVGNFVFLGLSHEEDFESLDWASNDWFDQGNATASHELQQAFVFLEGHWDMILIEIR